MLMLCVYLLLGSGVGAADLNRWGEENAHCWRISGADEMAAEQTGWKESEESAAENQEQGTHWPFNPQYGTA